jgi:hypothetical protein
MAVSLGVNGVCTGDLPKLCAMLREAARNIQGNLGRCLYRRKDVDEMQQVSGMLFEAADTIENLRGRLQEMQGVDNSRYHKLFGTPEHAAVTLVRTSDERAVCKLPTWTASSNDYEAWLEWLKGDA